MINASKWPGVGVDGSGIFCGTIDLSNTTAQRRNCDRRCFEELPLKGSQLVGWISEASVARMERSDIRDIARRTQLSRIALRSIRATVRQQTRPACHAALATFSGAACSMARI